MSSFTSLRLWMLCSIAAISAGLSCPVQVFADDKPNIPEVYRRTRDHAGHELVKTEQFVVPVGAVVAIDGLNFPAGSSELTSVLTRILQQVFNSLEEITENTVSDPDAARVAAFARMEFEIRGYADAKDEAERIPGLSEARARTVMAFLANLGTPPWRLHAKGMKSEKPPASKSASDGRHARRVEFVRIK